MTKQACATQLPIQQAIDKLSIQLPLVPRLQIHGRATLQFSHKPSWHDAELLSTQTLPEGMIWTQTSRAYLSYYSSVTEIVRKI
jgi:hypothetical protein